MDILLVDDNPAVRKAMRSCIEQNPDLLVCGEALPGFLLTTVISNALRDVLQRPGGRSAHPPASKEF